MFTLCFCVFKNVKRRILIMVVRRGYYVNGIKSKLHQRTHVCIKYWYFIIMYVRTIYILHFYSFIILAEGALWHGSKFHGLLSSMQTRSIQTQTRKGTGAFRGRCVFPLGVKQKEWKERKEAYPIHVKENNKWEIYSQKKI